MTAASAWCLAAGSLAGGFARFYLAAAVSRTFGARLPFGTLAVNVLGCLAIGLLAALPEDKMPLGPQGRMLLMTGFCGAFTTFSTFMLETGALLDLGGFGRAASNVLLSLIAGYAAYRLGVFLGKLI